MIEEKSLKKVAGGVPPVLKRFCWYCGEVLKPRIVSTPIGSVHYKCYKNMTGECQE